MTEITVIEALETVYLLAREGNVNNLEPISGTPEDRKRLKEDAVETYGDMMANLWEDIEDYFEEKGGIGTLYTEHGYIPEYKASDLKDIFFEVGREDITMVLNLAEDRLDSIGETETVTTHDEDAVPTRVKAHEAYNIATAFFHKYGRDLFGDMITMIELPNEELQPPVQ